MLAESYERIHRSNLIGMGIIPLQFCDGETASSLGLTGKESFTIEVPEDLHAGHILTVTVRDCLLFVAIGGHCCSKFSYHHLFVFAAQRWTVLQNPCEV